MKRLRILSVSIWVAAIFLINGCAASFKLREEDLVRLYAAQRRLSERNPLVFIPGITGSSLKKQKIGLTVWGRDCGGLIDLLGLPIDNAKLSQNRDDIVPVRHIKKFSCIPGMVEMEAYDRLVRAIPRIGGYVMNKDFFVLSYDWRRDLVETAQQLGALIERIKKESGRPEIKVDLLCHSAGGLIARYYAKYGTADILNEDPLPQPTYAGAANIDKIIMLGTPNCGLLETFQRLHEGLCVPALRCAEQEILFTMPSLYEILPHNGESVFIDSDGTPLDVDLYKAANWERYGWSVFSKKRQAKTLKKFLRDYGGKEGRVLYEKHIAKQRRFLEAVLRRAERFHRALWQGDAEEKEQVIYALLGSNCYPTVNRAILKQDKEGWKTQFKAEKGLEDVMYAFGDGSVTKDSLLGIRYTKSDQTQPGVSRLPASYVIFACEKHADLSRNPTFMNNIFHILFEEAASQL